jgi:hypothetical protein
MAPKLIVPNTHIIIPDTQVAPGVDTTHLEWVGQYIHDKYAGRDGIKVIHLGDHYDLPSLSWYDRGKRSMEGRRLEADIEAGNDGMDKLTFPFYEDHFEQYLLRGNHEDRLTRAMDDHPQLEGVLDFAQFNDTLWGWDVQDFKEVLNLDGVAYSHFFYQPMSGRPYGGNNVETLLGKIGQSFTQGHRQGLWYGLRNVLGGIHQGLVAGSCYTHHEEYKGPQANSHWRGIIVKYNVVGGQYDPKFVSLDSLCQRYEGMTLAAWKKRKRLA